LKIHPELRRGFEVDRQPDCQLGADPELAFHKLLDLGFRPVRGHGQVHDSHAQRLQQAIETVSPASYNYQGMALQKSPTPDYVSIIAFDIVYRLIPQNKTMRRKGKGTELRNQTLKSESRKLAHQTMSMDPEALAAGVDPLSLRIDPITPLAINAYHQWSGPSGFPWEAVLDWKTKDAKGLDLAFWFEEELCGLCYATPRRSTICMKIVLLQGHTCKTNTLRGWIAPMALLTTEFYARKLGCTQIEVQEPDSGAIPYYQTLGFYFDTTGRLVFPLDDQ
jgi:hypothetical protein